MPLAETAEDSEMAELRSEVIALKGREIVLEALLARVLRATQGDEDSDALLMMPTDMKVLEMALRRVRDGFDSGATATLQLISEIRGALKDLNDGMER
jgi:hypothetical protein